MWPNPQKTADLVTFTEEILNWKLHFLCSVCQFSSDIFIAASYFIPCFFYLIFLL